MKNISTVIVSSEHDDNEVASKSSKSVKIAGVESSTSVEPVKIAVEKDLEFCHFIKAGTIIMPDLYKAVINMCGKFDYAFCHCLSIPQGEVKIRPAPDNFIITQIIVKTWVVKELQEGNVNNLIRRVLTEYRGVEIPHIMAVEV